MKTPFLLAGALLAASVAALQPALAQAPASGVIAYEASRRLDPSQIRIVRNGDVVQAGGPDAPEVPDVITFSQKLRFTKSYAREEQETPGPVIRRFDGSGGEQTVKMEPPFIEKHYLDLTGRKHIQVLEVKKNGETKVYRAEGIFGRPADWQEAGKTKKIAGLTCRKATCSYRNQTYTVWYTTELGFTYSPLKALTPPQGVVLEVEGPDESFKAVRVQPGPVADSEVAPSAEGQLVSAPELEEMRNRAMADYRQRMFATPD
jgi:hypothetical protein